jgi:hypothetical protein
MKLRTLLGGAVLAGVLAVPTAAVAHPHPRSFPVPTDAVFGATVNGRTTHATIQVFCTGFMAGHPRPGQSVGVFIPEVMQSPAFGRTGTPVTGIVATLSAHENRVAQLGTFRRIRRTRPVSSATMALSTTLILPCTGTGTAVFTPVPARPGTKPAVVDVTFVKVP